MIFIQRQSIVLLDVLQLSKWAVLTLNGLVVAVIRVMRPIVLLLVVFPMLLLERTMCSMSLSLAWDSLFKKLLLWSVLTLLVAVMPTALVSMVPGPITLLVSLTNCEYQDFLLESINSCLLNYSYKLLLNITWVEKKWDGPKQFVDEDEGEIMMLPTDMALLEEPFRQYVELYAKDQQKFFDDFAAAFLKLIELGVAKRSKM